VRRLLAVGALVAAFMGAGAPAHAALVTHTLVGEVLFGPLAGATATGSFTFDDALITGVGDEFLTPLDGLQVQFTFLGATFSESDDIDFPEFPELAFTDGEIVGLDFLVEDADGRGATIPGFVEGFRTFPLELIEPGVFFAEILVLVPAPASLGLLVVGAVAFAAHRKLHRRS
jgi:hypothetical protein